MNYRASAEPVSGFLVRLHPEGGFGSPYDAACVVVPDGTTAVVKGYVGAATVAHGRAFDDLLRGLGFTEIRYERRAGESAWRTRRLDRRTRGTE